MRAFDWFVVVAILYLLACFPLALRADKQAHAYRAIMAPFAKEPQ